MENQNQENQNQDFRPPAQFPEGYDPQTFNPQLAKMPGTDANQQFQNPEISGQPLPQAETTGPQTSFLKTKRGKLVAALIALAFLGGIVFVTSQGGKFFKGQFSAFQEEKIAPVGLSVSLKNGQPFLEWQDDADPSRIENYQLGRSVEPGIKVLDTTFDNLIIQDFTADKKEYKDESQQLEKGKTYYYGIKTITDDVGKLGESNEVAIKIPTENNQKPAKPELVYPEEDTIVVKPFLIAWTDRAENDDGPQIKRNYQWKIFKENGTDIGWFREWHKPGTGPGPKNCDPIDTYKNKNTWTCPYIGIGGDNQDNFSSGTYFWQVEAGDGITGSGFTEKRKFTVVDKCPSGTAVKTTMGGLSSSTCKPVTPAETGKTAYETVPISLTFDLTPELIAAGKVKLTWTDSNSYPGEDETKIKHQILRDGTVIPNVELPKSTSEYTDTWPEEQKNQAHKYKVKTIGLEQSGTDNAISNEITVDPAAGTANQKPNKPSLYLPANNATNEKLTPELRWYDNGDPDNKPNTIRNYNWYIKDSTGQNVWKRTWAVADGGPADCSPLSAPQPKPQAGTWTCLMATVPSGKLEYGKTYKWAVKAGDGEKDSEFTDEWTFTTKSGPSQNTYDKPVSPPIEVKAAHKETNSTKGIKITWKETLEYDPAKPDGYTIYKKEGIITATPSIGDLKNWTKLAPPEGNTLISKGTTEFLESPADVTKDWTYVVTSTLKEKESGASNIAPVTKIIVLGTPTELKAVKGENVVNLTWKNPSDLTNIDGYEIYRKNAEVTDMTKEDISKPEWKKLAVEGDSTKLIPKTSSTKADNNDIDLTKTYSYIIRSVKTAGNIKSPFSNIALYKAEGAPSGVITLTAGEVVDGKIEFTWTDTTPEEKIEFYTLIRIDKNAPAGTEPKYSNIENKGTNGEWDNADRKVTDITAAEGKTYEYFIRSTLKNTENKINSNIIEKTISAAPPPPDTLAAPTNLAAVVKYDTASKGVELTWDKVAGSDGYIVYRKTGTQMKPPLTDLKDVAKGWAKVLPSGKDKIENPTNATEKPKHFDDNPDKLTTDPLTYVVIAMKSIAGAAGAAATIKESDPSSVATTNPAATQTPQTINLTATAGDKNVKLTWTDVNAADKVGTYDIYRSIKTPVKVSDIETKYVTGKPPSVKEYTDKGEDLGASGLTNDTTYYYMIIAGDKAGEFDIGISNEVTAKPAAPLPDPNKQICDAGIADLKTKKATFESNKTQANADLYNALYNQLVGKVCLMPSETELPKLLTAPPPPVPVVTPPPPPGPSVNEITCQVKFEQLKDAYGRYQVKPVEELADLYNTIRTSMQTLSCAVNASYPASVKAQVIEPPPFEDDKPEVAEKPEQQEPPKTEIKYIYKEIPVASAPVPMPIEYIAPAQVLHPVAGPKVPQETSGTGPEMWIYGVSALASIWGSRRILTKKKKK